MDGVWLGCLAGWLAGLSHYRDLSPSTYARYLVVSIRTVSGLGT